VRIHPLSSVTLFRIPSAQYRKTSQTRYQIAITVSQPIQPAFSWTDPVITKSVGRDRRWPLPHAGIQRSARAPAMPIGWLKLRLGEHDGIGGTLCLSCLLRSQGACCRYIDELVASDDHEICKHRSKVLICFHPSQLIPNIIDIASRCVPQSSVSSLLVCRCALRCRQISRTSYSSRRRKPMRAQTHLNSELCLQHHYSYALHVPPFNNISLTYPGSIQPTCPRPPPNRPRLQLAPKLHTHGRHFIEHRHGALWRRQEAVQQHESRRGQGAAVPGFCATGWESCVE